MVREVFRVKQAYRYSYRISKYRDDVSYYVYARLIITVCVGRVLLLLQQLIEKIEWCK